MKELDILLAHTHLDQLRKSIISSLEEIKQKHPTRLDLIDSMTIKAEDLMEAHLVFYALEKEHKRVISKMYELHLENQKLSKENKELKELL
tara:strand:- start:232 stop:504 length:273 start_codon:yes stop_codon:yes gene_type:complete